jgi:hypothetical protein
MGVLFAIRVVLRWRDRFGRRTAAVKEYGHLENFRSERIQYRLLARVPT